MTQPTPAAVQSNSAPQPVNPETLMLRVVDELGIALDDLADVPVTTKWMKVFEVHKPCPGELGPIYTVFALFHGCKGHEDDRVAQEQRVYLFPRATSPGGPPFIRLTFVPVSWGNDARHETMTQDTFVEEVAEEYELLLGLDDDEEEPETPENGALPDSNTALPASS